MKASFTKTFPFPLPNIQEFHLQPSMDGTVLPPMRPAQKCCLFKDSTRTWSEMKWPCVSRLDGLRLSSSHPRGERGQSAGHQQEAAPLCLVFVAQTLGFCKPSGDSLTVDLNQVEHQGFSVGINFTRIKGKYTDLTRRSQCHCNALYTSYLRQKRSQSHF